MMDEEIRQALSEVREMKQMCGNINMKLTNIVTQRGQNWKEKLEAEYQRGLDDAWECGKKLAWTAKYGGYGERLNDVFGRDDTFDFYDYTPNEAIEKLKAYEEQKADDEIKVGDEVVDSSGEKGLVVSDGNKCSDAIWLLINGYRVPQSVCKEDYTKTGRHFDIESILEDMRK